MKAFGRHELLSNGSGYGFGVHVCTTLISFNLVFWHLFSSTLSKNRVDASVVSASSLPLAGSGDSNVAYVFFSDSCPSSELKSNARTHCLGVGRKEGRLPLMALDREM